MMEAKSLTSERASSLVSRYHRAPPSQQTYRNLVSPQQRDAIQGRLMTVMLLMPTRDAAGVILC